MNHLIERITSESGLSRREWQIIELDAQLRSSNPEYDAQSRVSNPFYRATKHRYYHSEHDLLRNILARSRRYPEPQSRAINGSNSRHGRPSHPFNKLKDTLICRIARFANPTAAICLSVTCRRFMRLIKIDESSLSRCEKWFVMASLEQDYINHYSPQYSENSFVHHRHWRHFSILRSLGTSRVKDFSGLTCALCKVKHGPETWVQMSPRFWTFTVHDVFQTRSLERICPQHFDKTVFPIQDAIASSMNIPRWVCSKQEMCMHCGQMQVLAKCHCSAKDSRAGKIYLGCEICPVREVRVYARLGTQEDFDSVGWHFCKDKDGTMFVREDSGGNNLLLYALIDQSGSDLYGTMQMEKLRPN